MDPVVVEEPLSEPFESAAEDRFANVAREFDGITHEIERLNVDIAATQKASGGVAVVELLRCRQKVEFAENQREGERP